MDRARKVFYLLDRDSDGHVTAAEIESTMHEIGWVPPSSDYSIKAAIEELDVNQNGFLEFGEFFAAYVSMLETPGKYLLEIVIENMVQKYGRALNDFRVTAEKIEEAKQLFRVLDANSDGHVTEAEVRALLEGRWIHTDIDISQAIGEIDLNGNGQVEFHEFLRSFVKMGERDFKMAAIIELLRPSEVPAVHVMTNEDFDLANEVFRSLDVDQDGHVTAGELRSSLRRMVDSLTDTQLATVLGELDANKNGTLEFGEFLRAFSDTTDRYLLTPFVRLATRITQMSHDSDHQARQTAKHMFHYLDSDRDGHLTRTEIEKALQELGNPVIPGFEVDQAIRQLDKNENGAIEFEEFLQAYLDNSKQYQLRLLVDKMAMEHVVERLVTRATRFFNNYIDLDMDGHLTQQEITHVLAALGDVREDIDAGKAIAQLDINRNGTLEFDEFFEAFVDETGKYELSRLIQAVRDNPEYMASCVFKKIDTDKDGHITEPELRHAAEKLNIALDVHAAVKQIDVNNNGQIEFSEFVHAFNDSHSDNYVISALIRQMK